MIHKFFFLPFKVLGLERKELPLWIQILLALALLATGANLLYAFYDYFNHSGTDLRIRIVGARALLEGINPYTLDYSLDLPERLQDPDQWMLGLSRCSYPPPLLLFYMPLSFLSFQSARAVSMILEWMALFVSIGVLTRTLPKANKWRVFFLILALGGFGGSYFWRLHVERGQYHIFVALLISLWLYVALKKREDSWRGGVLLGLALSLRPTLGVILLFLFLAKYYKNILGAVICSSFVLLLTLPFGGITLWQDWRGLVDRYEDEVIHVPLKNLKEITHRVPAEGFRPDNNLDSLTKNSSGIAIFHKVERTFRLSNSPAMTKGIVRFIFGFSFLILFLLFFWANRKRNFSLVFLVSYSVLVAIFMELIIPLRVGYANIQYLLLFAPALPFLMRRKNFFFIGLICLGLLRTTSDYYKVALILMPIMAIMLLLVLKRGLRPLTPR